MGNIFKLLMLALVALVPVGTTQAALVFQATLTNDQETPITPPPQSSGGVATFVLNDAKTRLTYDVQLFGLDMRGINAATGISTPPNQPFPGEPVGSAARNDNMTRMHIHSQFFGVAGPIVFGMIDLPTNLATLNDLNDLVIDIANLHVTGAWDLNEGAGGQTFATQLNNLLIGGLYINVHTEDFPGGEIRGQILAVPEPDSLTLLGMAMLGLIPAALRRPRIVAA
jgi:hypothetical protein